MEQKTARQASIVTFGGKTVQDVITAAFEGGRVSKEERNNLKMLVEIAESNHVPPLVKLADTRFYAVYDGRTRSVEHNWAHVKHHNPDDTTESTDTSRLLGSGEQLMCKVM